MKGRGYLLLLVLSTPLRAAEPSTYKVPRGSTLSITFTTTNSVVTHNQNSAHATLPVKTTPPVEVATKAQTVSQASSSSFKILKTGILLAGTTLVGGYAYGCYQALKGNKYLKQDDLWCKWQSHLTLEQLLSKNTQEITQELIEQIHGRYPINQASQAIRPFTTFLTTIEAQEKELEWFSGLYQLLTTYRIARCIPFDHELFGHIHEYQQRLSYFKNLFLSWCGQHSFNSLRMDKYRTPCSRQMLTQAIAIDARHLLEIIKKRKERLTPGFKANTEHS